MRKTSGENSHWNEENTVKMIQRHYFGVDLKLVKSLEYNIYILKLVETPGRCPGLVSGSVKSLYGKKIDIVVRLGTKFESLPNRGQFSVFSQF